MAHLDELAALKAQMVALQKENAVLKKYFGILLVGLSFGICGVSSADVYQCKGGFSGDKKPVEVFPDEFEINMCVDSLIHRNGTIFQYLGTKEPFRALRIFAKGGMEDNPKALVEWSNRKRYYKCQWIQKHILPSL